MHRSALFTDDSGENAGALPHVEKRSEHLTAGGF